MTRFGRILLGVLVLLIVTMGAWAGGQGEGEEADDEGPIELTYWDHQFPWLVEWNEAAIEEYEAENPNVTIDFTIDNAHQRVMPAMNAGSGPDIAAPHDAKVVQLMLQDMLAPLDLEAFPELDSYDDVRDSWFPGSLTPFTGPDGTVYAVPLEYNVPGLTVNRNLLEMSGLDPDDPDNIPSTWDDVGRIGGEIFSEIGTDDDGTVVYEGWDWPYSDRRDWQRNEIRTVFAQYGASFITEDNEVVVDSPEAVEAMTMMRDLIREHETGDPDALPGAEGRDWQIFEGTMALGRFVAGELPKMVASSDVADQLEVHPYPQTGEGDSVLTVRSHSLMVNGSISERKQREAWKFVNFLTQRWEELAQVGFNPSRINQPGLDTPWYETDTFEQMREETQTLQSIPIDVLARGDVVWEVDSRLFGTPESQLRANEITDQVAEAMEAIIKGGEDVESALGDAREEIESMLMIE